MPGEAAISVLTKAELRVGVLAAEDIETRDRRLMTFELRGRIVSLPVDERGGREHGRRCAPTWPLPERRVSINDMWIAATAAAHGCR